ncbi:MAG: hypothetical protein QXE79_06450 [Candidatus Bathyarchaeia archaeon]
MSGGGSSRIHEGSLEEFHSILLEAVDEGLLALGESVRQAIYRHMDKRYSIRREELPDKAGEFAIALRDMLGAGSEVLLRFMARRLYIKLKLGYEEKPGWGFLDYVNHAKKVLRSA